MRGKLKVYTGPMFAGKTSTMIQELEKYDEFVAFKPNMDNRYSEEKIVSHDGNGIQANSIPTDELIHIIKSLEYDGISAVGFDEAQFFDDSLIDAVDHVLECDTDVLVSGLDLDFRRENFGCMYELIKKSDEYEKLLAKCEVCGSKAEYTQRIIDGEPASYDDPVVLIGAEEEYEPRCDNHHVLSGEMDSNYEDLLSDIG